MLDQEAVVGLPLTGVAVGVGLSRPLLVAGDQQHVLVARAQLDRGLAVLVADPESRGHEVAVLRPTTVAGDVAHRQGTQIVAAEEAGADHRAGEGAVAVAVRCRAGVVDKAADIAVVGTSARRAALALAVLLERDVDDLDVAQQANGAGGVPELDAVRAGQRGDAGAALGRVDLDAAEQDVVDQPGAVALEQDGHGVGRPQLDRDLLEQAVAVIDRGRAGPQPDPVGLEAVERPAAVAGLDLAQHALVGVQEIEAPAVGVDLALRRGAAGEQEVGRAELVAVGADAALGHADGHAETAERFQSPAADASTWKAPALRLKVKARSPRASITVASRPAPNRRRRGLTWISLSSR